MVQTTIEQIEQRLKESGSIPEEKRRELLELLATLKQEADALARTNLEHARSIAAYADVSTYEATRRERNPELMKHSLEGLSLSVEGFEKSHPKLVQIVNRIAHTLSNFGI